jgi:hypothetical protein
MRGNHQHALQTAPSGGAINVALPLDSDPKFGVTVVSTTPDGTAVALRAAADLAKQLGAHITLVAPEVVPIHLPVDRPRVPVEFLERHYCNLVAAAGITDEPVTIRIWLCRDREDCLKQTLAPHSLIVVGGRVRWWNRSERSLAQWLGTMGHHVVFVDSAGKQRVEPKTERARGPESASYSAPEREVRPVDR